MYSQAPRSLSMTALLDVDQLRTFIAIVETGSFTRAAETVHKTQSAVSMQMKRLEERLARPIFTRDGRENRPCQPLFQPLHLHRHRRLRLVNGLGRAGEAAGFHDSDERTQLVDVEQRGHG